MSRWVKKIGPNQLKYVQTGPDRSETGRTARGTDRKGRKDWKSIKCKTSWKKRKSKKKVGKVRRKRKVGKVGKVRKVGKVGKERKVGPVGKPLKNKKCWKC